MGNDEVASVNARREYKGNVMVSVNQKSLSRGCTVVIENAWVVFSVGHTASASLPHLSLVYKSRRAAVLKSERNRSFYLRLSHFIPVESQRKLSDHESKSSSLT